MPPERPSSRASGGGGQATAASHATAEMSLVEEQPSSPGMPHAAHHPDASLGLAAGAFDPSIPLSSPRRAALMQRQSVATRLSKQAAPTQVSLPPGPHFAAASMAAAAAVAATTGHSTPASPESMRSGGGGVNNGGRHLGSLPPPLSSSVQLLLPQASSGGPATAGGAGGSGSAAGMPSLPPISTPTPTPTMTTPSPVAMNMEQLEPQFVSGAVPETLPPPELPVDIETHAPATFVESKPDDVVKAVKVEEQAAAPEPVIIEAAPHQLLPETELPGPAAPPVPAPAPPAEVQAEGDRADSPAPPSAEGRSTPTPIQPVSSKPASLPLQASERATPPAVTDEQAHASLLADGDRSVTPTITAEEAFAAAAAAATSSSLMPPPPSSTGGGGLQQALPPPPAAALLPQDFPFPGLQDLSLEQQQAMQLLFGGGGGSGGEGGGMGLLSPASLGSLLGGLDGSMQLNLLSSLGSPMGSGSVLTSPGGSLQGGSQQQQQQLASTLQLALLQGAGGGDDGGSGGGQGSLPPSSSSSGQLLLLQQLQASLQGGGGQQGLLPGRQGYGGGGFDPLCSGMSGRPRQARQARAPDQGFPIIEHGYKYIVQVSGQYIVQYTHGY